MMTIAHRLDTIVSSDKILVMDQVGLVSQLSSGDNDDDDDDDADDDAAAADDDDDGVKRNLVVVITITVIRPL
jgi:hypothetical protein